jgi:cytochrome c553
VVRWPGRSSKQANASSDAACELLNQDTNVDLKERLWSLEEITRPRRLPVTVPACATCHGPQARGNDIFPRLAGQHADYLVKQVLVIQRDLRTSPVMHEVIKNLSQDQMRAVATYLESLSP